MLETLLRRRQPVTSDRPGALLVLDLDQVGGEPQRFARNLDAVISCAGPGLGLVAAGLTPAITRYGPVCASRGAIVLTAPPGPSTADHQLIGAALALTHRGEEPRFLVASSDKAFAALALHGTIELVAITGAMVSQQLAAVATTTHRPILTQSKRAQCSHAAPGEQSAAPATAQGRKQAAHAQEPPPRPLAVVPGLGGSAQ